MSNADYLAKKLREAAANPKALLLGAIGAMCPTATEAAKVAEALGLGKEEIQGARWVAVAKRDKPTPDFLKILREATGADQKKEEKTVEEKTVEEKRREEEFALYNAARALAGSRIAAKIIELTEKGKIQWTRLTPQDQSMITYTARVGKKITLNLFWSSEERRKEHPLEDEYRLSIIFDGHPIHLPDDMIHPHYQVPVPEVKELFLLVHSSAYDLGLLRKLYQI